MITDEHMRDATVRVHRIDTKGRTFVCEILSGDDMTLSVAMVSRAHVIAFVADVWLKHWAPTTLGITDRPKMCKKVSDSLDTLFDASAFPTHDELPVDVSFRRQPED